MGKKNAYPSEIRLFARSCYLQGNSLAETAQLVKQQYPGARCNAETIRRWASNPEDPWNDARERVTRSTTSKQEKSVSTLLEEHAELYRLAIAKGKSGLKDRSLTPRSAAEAGGLLDLGIRGQRAALKELISLNFVRAVFQIVAEEVDDAAARGRIAVRLRELSNNWKGGDESNGGSELRNPTETRALREGNSDEDSGEEASGDWG